MGSNESLASLNSANTHRKSDRIKYLEAKVAELSVLLRQKNTSLEMSAKEIDKLRSELQKSTICAENLIVDTKIDTSKEQLEIAEERSDLSSMLSKAEANLAAVDRLSEEVIAQKDEQYRKTIHELDSVKNKLVSSEKEVKVLRSQLAGNVEQIEDLSRQLAQLTMEIGVKNTALEDAKAIRSEMLDAQLARDEELRNLQAKNEGLEKEVKKLTADLEQLQAALVRQERETAEVSDRARAAEAETERAKSRVRSVEVRASEREADLKDRVRLLEERLVLLTEPDAALFSEHMEEAKLSSDPIPNADSPETASARCVALLVERKLLETRLVETRKHLEEVKTTWNEKLASLESQITHLNEKIAEDSTDHARMKAEWENQQKKVEAELAEAIGKQAEAEAALRRAESERKERERLSEEHCREWELVRASLEAKVTAMQQAAQTESRTHADALNLSQELQSRISTLEEAVEKGAKEADALKKEKEELRTRLDEKTAEIKELQFVNSNHTMMSEENHKKVTMLEQELEKLTATNGSLCAELASLNGAQEDSRKSANAQVTALKEELTKLEAEVRASAEQIADARKRTELATTKCEQLQSERDSLQNKITEMESEFLNKLAEVDSKQKEYWVAQTSSEILSLKASVDELNGVISDRNKTIRLQKQKLSELKKALGHELRSTTASNLSLLSVDEEVHNHHHLSGAGKPGDTAGPPATADEVTLPPLLATSRQVGAGAPPPASPPAILPVSETAPKFEPRCAMLVPPTTPPLADCQGDNKIINFEYMRHVLLKFLLSRDAEALQLVRAVATVLRLSKKDEFLIRQKLEERRSWFVTPVVSPKSSGQFAKVVPH